MACLASKRFWCLTAIVIVTGVVFLLAYHNQPPSTRPDREPNSTFPMAGGNKRLLLEGFSTMNYTPDGKVASRLHLGKCELRNKSTAFWMFDAGPVLEVHDLQVDLFDWRRTDQTNTNPAAPESSEAITALTRLPQQFRWGTIGGLAVHNVSFNLHAADQPDITIRAQRLTPGSHGELTLDKTVSVSARDGDRQLTSDNVIWWPNFGVLAVKGAYQLTAAGHPHHGTRALFNLSLEPITNQQEIRSYEEQIQHKTELTMAQ